VHCAAQQQLPTVLDVIMKLKSVCLATRVVVLQHIMMGYTPAQHHHLQA
jgi:hypothetical protein